MGRVAWSAVRQGSPAPGRQPRAVLFDGEYGQPSRRDGEQRHRGTCDGEAEAIAARVGILRHADAVPRKGGRSRLRPCDEATAPELCRPPRTRAEGLQRLLREQTGVARDSRSIKALGDDYLAEMSLSAPVLIVQGEQDVIRETNAVLAARFPTATNVRIPDTGHFPWVEEPAVFSKTVLDFYSRVASAAPA